jgi:hypothetical protein
MFVPDQLKLLLKIFREDGNGASWNMDLPGKAGKQMYSL